MFYNKESNRILWVDWLKVLAIIGVLGLHSSSQFFSQDIIFTFNWQVGVVFESLFRFGIILFLMVSGFLILRKPEPVSNFPKRFKRVFIPFIFWLIIYIIVKLILFGDFNILNLFHLILDGLLNPTDVSIQFWFVYMIIGLYLFAPVLSKWIQNSSLKEIEYFLLVWVFISILQFFDINTIINDYFRYFAGAIGYFILGYYLAFKDSKYLRSRKFGLFLFVLGTLIAIIGTFTGSYLTGKSYFLFFVLGDITPNACLQAIGLFIIIKNTNFRKLSDKTNNLAVLVSLESYGVYLCNILIIRILQEFSLFSINENALIAIPGVFIIAFLVSNLLIYIMSKIPILDKFTGFKSIL